MGSAANPSRLGAEFRLHSSLPPEVLKEPSSSKKRVLGWINVLRTKANQKSSKSNSKFFPAVRLLQRRQG